MTGIDGGLNNNPTNPEPVDFGMFSKEQRMRKQIYSPDTRLFDCYPGGNPTFIAFNKQIQPEGYSDAGKIVMADFPHFEQGGFLNPSHSGDAAIRLQMSGGEFCGNASRSAAALFIDDYLKNREFQEISNYSLVKENNGIFEFPLETSPGNKILSARVTPTHDGYDVQISLDMKLAGMTSSHRISVDNREVDVNLVTMDGISHVLIPAVEVPFPNNDKDRLADIAAQIRSALNLNDLPAVGAIWHSDVIRWPGSLEMVRIEPVVWVREINTCIHETSCGSGSMAFAIAHQESANSSNMRIEIQQPSNYPITTAVHVGQDGDVSVVSIAGKVFIRSDLNQITLTRAQGGE